MIIVAREKEGKVRMAEKEYIERKSLIDEFENLMRDDNVMCQVIKVLDVLEIVEEVPSADVAEIVRCKNCQHFEGISCGYCKEFDRAVWTNEYCSHGVIRMENKNEQTNRTLG